MATQTEVMLGEGGVVGVDSKPSYYLMFTADMTDDQARREYSKRYGKDPERVFRLFGAGREVWAGPVPKQDTDVNAL